MYDDVLGLLRVACLSARPPLVFIYIRWYSPRILQLLQELISDYNLPRCCAI